MTKTQAQAKFIIASRKRSVSWHEFNRHNDQNAIDEFESLYQSSSYYQKQKWGKKRPYYAPKLNIKWRIKMWQLL